MFELKIKTENYNSYKEGIKSAEDMVEPILARISASNDVFCVTSKTDPTQIIFLVRTNSRKRLSLLRNSLKKFIHSYNQEDYNSLKSENDKLKYSYETLKVPEVEKVLATTKKDFFKQVNQFQKSENYNVKSDTTISTKYNGEDLKVLMDRKNWYSWQTSLYNLLYDHNNNLRSAHDREIIHCLCTSGNSRQIQI
jgi:hypothetical protein